MPLLTARFVEYVGELNHSELETLLSDAPSTSLLRLYLSALAYIGRVD